MIDQIFFQKNLPFSGGGVYITSTPARVAGLLVSGKSRKKSLDDLDGQGYICRVYAACHSVMHILPHLKTADIV